MKKVCALCLVAALQSALLYAEPLATKDKITRDEAQHIALAQVPDGSVKSAELARVDGKGIWRVEIAKAGASGLIEIQVDASSGHLVSGEPASPAQGPDKEKPKQ